MDLGGYDALRMALHTVAQLNKLNLRDSGTF